MTNNRTVLCISFRKSEMWLLEKLKTYSCPSGTVKDILKEHFKNTDKESTATTSSNSINNTLNIMDF